MMFLRQFPPVLHFLCIRKKEKPEKEKPGILKILKQNKKQFYFFP
jgi:hypothetical protein